MSVLDRVLPLLTIAASFGYENLPDGTRVIGKVPHVTPETWLHVVGRRLTPEEIRQLESELGKRISGEFRAFLSDANGLSVFSDSISLLGLRTSYRREPSDAF